MKTDSSSQSVTTWNRIGTRVFATILVLLPFHALLTVYGAALAGHYALLQIWKEVLLLALVPLALLLIYKTPELRQRMYRLLFATWLYRLLLAYAAVQIGLGLWALTAGRVNLYAFSYAMVINLRFFLILALGMTFAAASPWLQRHWRQLLLWPAVLVVAFGLLQAMVLPVDFLQHFGYGPATIEPYETVDQKLDYLRIQSTLRGSNPLGAYLIVVLAGSLVLLRRKLPRYKWLLAGFIMAAVLTLFLTYSRSAYIGLALALCGLLVLAARSHRARRLLVANLVGLVLIAAGSMILLRDNDRFQNAFFHTDEHSQSSQSSNGERRRALSGGLHDVLTEPLGRGPGTAGPASEHNDRPARIAENYYLQVGQETGWLGLGLFVSIVALVAVRLWRLRSQPLARAMLVSLVGLSFIGLVQHVWTDDTVALVWWGFAGIALGSARETTKT